MGIIAEHWQSSEGVHLEVQRVTGLRRLRGLIGAGRLAGGQAMRFPRCRSVHTFGMTHSIDVVFVSRSHRVIAARTLVPWRMAYVRGAHEVFELAAGEATSCGLDVGARLAMGKPERSR